MLSKVELHRVCSYLSRCSESEVFNRRGKCNSNLSAINVNYEITTGKFTIRIYVLTAISGRSVNLYLCNKLSRSGNNHLRRLVESCRRRIVTYISCRTCFIVCYDYSVFLPYLNYCGIFGTLGCIIKCYSCSINLLCTTYRANAIYVTMINHRNYCLLLKHNLAVGTLYTSSETCCGTGCILCSSYCSSIGMLTCSSTAVYADTVIIFTGMFYDFISPSILHLSFSVVLTNDTVYSYLITYNRLIFVLHSIISNGAISVVESIDVECIFILILDCHVTICFIVY